jgi:hypothetical protein
MSRNVAGNDEQALALAYTLAETASSESYRGYLESLLIDSRPEPKKFWAGCDPWQRELADRLAPALQYVAGMAPLPTGPVRHFWVMPRGHDKTTSIGRAVNWLLGYTRRPIRASVAAADKDQAKIITESMKAEAHLNPWLKKHLSFASGKVIGRHGSRLEVHSSDVAGTWGLNEDIYVLDEITWWENDKLWMPLISAFAKRKGVVVLIISNAGEQGSWQEGVWKEAQADKEHWQTWTCPEGICLASWMDYKQREADRRMMPKPMGRRVFDNVWIDPAEVGGYLTLDDTKRCEDESLPRFVAQPIRGVRYAAAIDYGPKKDRTVLALGHEDQSKGVVVVDRLDVWQGSKESPVPIADVERWLDEVASVFHADITCDPYQLEGTIQKYEHTHKVERFEARGGKSNYELAECVRSLVVNRKLLWHPAAGRLLLPDGTTETFGQELSRLIIKPTMYGYRVDHTSGRHDDRAVAVGMLCLLLLRDVTRGTWVPPVAMSGRPGSRIMAASPQFNFKLNIPKNRFNIYGLPTR